MKEYEIHEAAKLFPMMDDDAFREFKADIKKHGQKNPVELLDGKIIDGRNRANACRMLGLDVVTTNVNDLLGDQTPHEYVMSLNLHRRQLTPSQLALVARKFKAMEVAHAKERQRDAGKEHGRGQGKLPLHVPEPISRGDARDKAAAKVNICGAMVDMANRVHQHGVPELEQAVEQGKISLRAARAVSRLPPEEQEKVVAEGVDAIKESAAKVHKENQTRIDKENFEKKAKQDNEPTSRGVGVRLASEACNCLKQIPLNDGLRERAFEIVQSWIKVNR